MPKRKRKPVVPSVQLKKTDGDDPNSEFSVQFGIKSVTNLIASLEQAIGASKDLRKSTEHGLEDPEHHAQSQICAKGHFR